LAHNKLSKADELQGWLDNTLDNWPPTGGSDQESGTPSDSSDDDDNDGNMDGAANNNNMAGASNDSNVDQGSEPSGSVYQTVEHSEPPETHSNVHQSIENQEQPANRSSRPSSTTLRRSEPSNDSAQARRRQRRKDLKRHHQGRSSGDSSSRGLPSTSKSKKKSSDARKNAIDRFKARHEARRQESESGVPSPTKRGAPHNHESVDHTAIRDAQRAAEIAALPDYVDSEEPAEENVQQPHQYTVEDPPNYEHNEDAEYHRRESSMPYGSPDFAFQVTSPDPRLCPISPNYEPNSTGWGQFRASPDYEPAPRAPEHRSNSRESSILHPAYANAWSWPSLRQPINSTLPKCIV